MKVWIIIIEPTEPHGSVDNSFRHIPMGEIAGVFLHAIDAHNAFEQLHDKAMDAWNKRVGKDSWNYLSERNWRSQNACVEFDVIE